MRPRRARSRRPRRAGDRRRRPSRRSSPTRNVRSVAAATVRVAAPDVVTRHAEHEICVLDHAVGQRSAEMSLERQAALAHHEPGVARRWSAPREGPRRVDARVDAPRREMRTEKGLAHRRATDVAGAHDQHVDASHRMGTVLAAGASTDAGRGTTAMGPLEGVRVIELGVWVAGPAAGGLLADWGADVVKIESPEGDPARGFAKMLGGDVPFNPPFEMDNRSKRSIVIDFAQPGGLDLALELHRRRRRLRHQHPPRRARAARARPDSRSRTATRGSSTGSSPGTGSPVTSATAPRTTSVRSGHAAGSRGC